MPNLQNPYQVPFGAAKEGFQFLNLDPLSLQTVAI